MRNSQIDVYSFGILMFEVLTGQKAYDDCIQSFDIIFPISSGMRPTFKTPVKPLLDIDIATKYDCTQNLSDRCEYSLNNSDLLEY